MTSRSKKTYLFKNENFGVRETLEDDIETWYKWFNDPEVNKYLSPHGNIPNTLEAQKNFRNRHLNGKNGKIIFSIEESKKNEIIGTCSINIDFLNPARRAEISIIMGSKKYCFGPIYLSINVWLLNHCFNHLNLNSILAGASEENTVVCLTLERLGFNKIGKLRSTTFINGKYLNSIYYDMLREDWEKNQLK